MKQILHKIKISLSILNIFTIAGLLIPKALNVPRLDLILFMWTFKTLDKNRIMLITLKITRNPEMKIVSFETKL